MTAERIRDCNEVSSADETELDASDAESLYRVLEQQVVPLLL